MPSARRDDDLAFSPLYESMELLQGKWTLHIVQALLEGPRGFNELARVIGGCNPATLAQRLENLEACGLVAKTVHSTMPPRTSYALTRAGEALQDVIAAIDRWGQRHARKAHASSLARRAGRR